LQALKIAVNYAFNPNKVMYTDIMEAKFINRPNRFIANIEVDGVQHICHVKNTGRCKELLTEDAKIYVKKHNNPNRKTNYSLISVLKGDVLINMDSQVPNKAVHKWLLQNNFFDDIEYIKPEYKYHNSRIDFFIKTRNKRILLEVKGVTLEENGIAMFPDAPTERGINHIKELINAKEEGYESYIFFVIQMKGIKYFTPNGRTHPEFKEALITAEKAGVNIIAYDCIVFSESIAIDSPCIVML
jgi:sugar fermentation stimulation protein A